MNWINTILLAVVEGLTEFLPVSSTGHMIIASSVLRVPQTPFLSSFEIVVQVGAIMAVLSKYWKLLLRRRDYWIKIILAFIPTSIVGFAGYSLFKSFFLGNLTITMMGLLLGGLIMIVVESRIRRVGNIEPLPYHGAISVGLLQAFSIIPGVSRSAATIVAGELLGLSRTEAVKFSFLLGLPVLIAASGYDLFKTGLVFSAQEWVQIGVGILIAFITARVTIDWLLRLVEKRSLAVFGWYRVVLSLLYFTSLWVFAG